MLFTNLKKKKKKKKKKKTQYTTTMLTITKLFTLKFYLQ